jgi:hypothetical protein
MVLPIALLALGYKNRRKIFYYYLSEKILAGGDFRRKLFT